MKLGLTVFVFNLAFCVISAKAQTNENAWGTQEKKKEEAVVEHAPEKTSKKKSSKIKKIKNDKKISHGETNEEKNKVTLSPPLVTIPSVSEAPAQKKEEVSVTQNSSASSGSNNLVFSGFIDPQYRWRKPSQYSQGFLIQDAALYISQSNDVADFKLDLPFSMKNLNDNSDNLDFAVGKTRAQAYVQLKSLKNLRIKLGQFDTTYGFEGNDTADVTFTKQGHIYEFSDPFAHTGLGVAWDMNSALTFNMLYANPQDGGLMTSKNPQIGAQFVYAGGVRGSIGLLYNRSKQSSGGDITRFYDATFGFNLGSHLSIDSEASFRKIGNSSPYRGGFLLQIVQDLSEKSSLGIRGEYIKNIALRDSSNDGTATDPVTNLLLQPASERQVLVYFGPQFKITDKVKLKIDGSYQFDRLTRSDSRLRDYGFNTSLSYKF